MCKGQRRKSSSQKAGLVFPVGRIARYLKTKWTRRFRIGKTAPPYLAAVLEYLSAEILELAGNVCGNQNKKRIYPRMIMLAVGNDEELDKLFRCNINLFHRYIFAGAGSFPKIKRVKNGIAVPPE